MGQSGSAEQGHKGDGKGQETFIKGFSCGLSTHRVSDEHDHKINRIVLPKACAGKAHPFLKRFEQTELGEDLGKDGTSPNHERREGTDSGAIWTCTEECVILLACPPICGKHITSIFLRRAAFLVSLWGNDVFPSTLGLDAASTQEAWPRVCQPSP